MPNQLLQMHPVTDTGSLDESINIFPYVQRECIVNENGIQIQLQDKLTAGTGININSTDNTISIINSAIVNLIYPIGSIYISLSSTNPGTLFGVGTWQRIQDRFLYAAVDDDAVYGPNKSGGYKDAIIPAHSHSVTGNTASAGAHVHNVAFSMTGLSLGEGTTATNTGSDTTSSAGAHTHSISGTAATTGESVVGKNMPPFMTVYMWKRMA